MPTLLSAVPRLPDDITTMVVAMVGRLGVVDADMLVLRAPSVLGSRGGYTALLEMAGAATRVYECEGRHVESRVGDACHLWGLGNRARGRVVNSFGNRIAVGHGPVDRAAVGLNGRHGGHNGSE
jgi:hypothetical protein